MTCGRGSSNTRAARTCSTRSSCTGCTASRPPSAVASCSARVSSAWHGRRSRKLAPELSAEEVELAWRVGVAERVPEAAVEAAGEAYLALLGAFERRWGRGARPRAARDLARLARAGLGDGAGSNRRARLSVSSRACPRTSSRGAGSGAGWRSPGARPRAGWRASRAERPRSPSAWRRCSPSRRRIGHHCSTASPRRPRSTSPSSTPPAPSPGAPGTSSPRTERSSCGG